MLPLYKLALQVYIKSLEAHIRTKTLDPLFHEKSAEFYDTLFSFAHKIGERSEDIGIAVTPDMDCEKIISDLYDSVEVFKNALEIQIKAQNSIGTDNLLRGIADESENLCANIKAFMNFSENEEKQDKESMKDEKAEESSTEMKKSLLKYK